MLVVVQHVYFFVSGLSACPISLPGTYIMKLCCVSTALLSVTALNYLLSLVSLVLFYVYYTHSDGCTENKVFISINMLLCVGASVLSILPQIQVHTASLLHLCLSRNVHDSAEDREISHGWPYQHDQRFYANLWTVINMNLRNFDIITGDATIGHFLASSDFFLKKMMTE